MAPICRSAALGRSPPRMPSCTQPSMRSRWSPSARRSARTAPSSACVEAPLDADDRGRDERAAPAPGSGAGRRPGSRHRGRGDGERRPQQAPAERLPDLVAPLLGAQHVVAVLAAGIQRRRRRDRLEAAHDRARARDLLARLERGRGDGPAARTSRAGRRTCSGGGSSTSVVVQRLDLERPLHGRAGVRAVDDVEPDRHAARYYARPMLLVVDVGNTQTHFGTFRTTSSSSTGASRPCATSTADELGAALRNLLELRGIGLADLERVDRLDHGPAAAARVAGDGRALPRPRDARRRARHRRRAWPCATTTRARSAPTAWSTPSPPTSACRRAAACVDFGTAITFDPVSKDGEYLGGIIAPGVEISMEALTARAAAAAAHRPRRAADADRQDDGRRDPLGRRSTASPGRSTASCAACAPSSATSSRRSPPAAWPCTSSRSPTRSTRPTTCSR